MRGHGSLRSCTTVTTSANADRIENEVFIYIFLYFIIVIPACTRPTARHKSRPIRAWDVGSSIELLRRLYRSLHDVFLHAKAFIH